MNHNPISISHLECPLPFEPDWHHVLRDRLSVFPRFISLPGRDGSREFWPDLATFTDDFSCRLLMYFSSGSCDSICVSYGEDSGIWEAIKFSDSDIVAKATGESYERTMYAAVVEFT